MSNTKIKITPAIPDDETPFGTLSIELTVREAKALLALSKRIGGNPDRSARSLFDEIREALWKTGIEVNPTEDFIKDSPGRTGTIHFKDYVQTEEGRNRLTFCKNTSFFAP